MEINPSYFGIMCMLFGASLSFFFYRALQKSDYTRINMMINNLKDEYLLTVTNSLQENKHLQQQIRHQSSQTCSSGISMQDLEDVICSLKNDLVKVQEDSQRMSQNLMEQLQHCQTQEVQQLNDQFKQSFLNSKPLLLNMLHEKTRDLPLSKAVKEHLHTELTNTLTYVLHTMHRYQVQLFLECNNKNIEELSPDIQDKLMKTAHDITTLINKLNHVPLNREANTSNTSDQVTRLV